MSLMHDNVIPMEKGRVFESNAETETDLIRIKESLLTLKGVKKVVYDENSFPLRFTIYTNELVTVEDVEYKVTLAGFHAIPKELIDLL